jgi:hypothetical protein
MKDSINLCIQNLNTNSAPTDMAYLSLSKKIDFEIDDDYLDFIKRFNGAEGFLGQDSFVLFWNIDDLLALNPYYEDNEESEKLFFFGTDGSNLDMHLIRKMAVL